MYLGIRASAGLRSGPRFYSCAKVKDVDKPEDGGLVAMLIFYCTDCLETINATDDERPDQILDRLDKHVTKCRLATFTYEGTTDVARQILDNLRSVLESVHLAVR